MITVQDKNLMNMSFTLDSQFIRKREFLYFSIKNLLHTKLGKSEIKKWKINIITDISFTLIHNALGILKFTKKTSFAPS